MSRPAILDQTSTESSETPFGAYEEQAIVSLLLDHPDIFVAINSHLDVKLFKRTEIQYIMAHILNYYEKYEVYPSREMLHDIVAKDLTIDTPNAEETLQIVKNKSSPRDVPGIKNRILEWARHQSYALIYSKDNIDKFQRGQYDFLEEQINRAKAIQDSTYRFVDFWDDIEACFVQSAKSEFTTGFIELDNAIDTKGPCRREVLVWMAPTGVGKSIMLANNAVANAKLGRNVLYITLELSDTKSAIRAVGALTQKSIGSQQAREDNKAEILSIVSQYRQNDSIGDIKIIEFPADTITASHLDGVIDYLKKAKGWQPDMVIIDYLELMLSTRGDENSENYLRQKSVATQIRALAARHNVCIFTATQTNRSGNESESQEKGIDVTQIAESYGKAMSIDYLISINQTQEEYQKAKDSGGPADARLFFAKNRNGQKFVTVPVRIYYNSMYIKPEQQL